MNFRVNPPERILDNIRTAPDRMARVDAVLGDQRLLEFSEAVSFLLVQTQTNAPSLASLSHEGLGGAMTVANIVNAAAEFETAWNSIRLCNVPASQRQGRVATEFCGRACIIASPRAELLRLPGSSPVTAALRNHNDKSVLDLVEIEVSEDQTTIVPAGISATLVYRSFVDLLKELGFDQARLDSLAEYRKVVQHPASHGSSELLVYHFEGFEGGPAGNMFSEGRFETYRSAADQLIAIVHLMTDALAFVAQVYREKGFS